MDRYTVLLLHIIIYRNSLSFLILTLSVLTDIAASGFQSKNRLERINHLHHIKVRHISPI